jgi:hypothetical protein
LPVTVGVGRVGVRSCGVLLRVRQSVAVRVRVSVTGRVRIQSVGNLPTVRQTVVIGVGVVRVRAFSILLSIGKPVSVPISPTIVGVKWIRAGMVVSSYADGTSHQHEEHCNQHARILHFLYFIHFVFLPKISSENPPFSLSGKMLAPVLAQTIESGSDGC